MMNEAISVLVEEPDDATAQIVRQGLGAYNQQQGEIGYAKVQVIARDEGGVICGGAIGYAAWGELYIDILWVDERVRGQGIGSRLMALAEAEAVRLKCHRIHLGTMSSQAPHFYPKIGYIQYVFMPGKNGWPDRYLFYKELPT